MLSKAPDTSLARLSLLDWIGVLVVGGSGAFGLLVPVLIAPMFRRLSDSLGSTGPSLASWVLQGWVPASIAVLPLAVLACALAVPRSVMRRRLLLLLAFALTVFATAVLLFALYGTLFSLAGAAAGP
ncbi:MAG TPA: hypothetical protein VLQ79_10875 [Myxococcaceae bacterium]|nr:hypothetical protein [Myxococcaceae bacterium]